MTFRLVETIADALRVRTLRNSCRAYMTNYSGYIGLVQQILWYLRHYRPARKNGSHRLYLLLNEDDRPVAYGGLSLNGSQLLITECVDSRYRRKGYGIAVLNHGLGIASKEHRDLVAEIWATNQGSITLHEKSGFKLVSTRIKGGKELRRYLLFTDHTDRENAELPDRSSSVA